MCRRPEPLLHDNCADHCPETHGQMETIVQACTQLPPCTLSTPAALASTRNGLKERPSHAGLPVRTNQAARVSQCPHPLQNKHAAIIDPRRPHTDKEVPAHGDLFICTVDAY